MSSLYVNGYLHTLIDNDQSPRDFILSFAKSYGFLIRMRDEPADTPMPFAFDVDPHHQTHLREAQTALNLWNQMSSAEQQSCIDADNAEEYERHAKSQEKHQKELGKLSDTLTKLAKWTPSALLADMKADMVKQLADAIEGECKPTTPPKLKTTKAHRDKLIWDVDYHAEQWQKEQDRTAQQNRYLTALHESLKEVPA